MRIRLLTFLTLFAMAIPAAASTKASTMHYLKALLLQRQGNSAEAFKEYEAASQLDPHSHFILEQAAKMALDIGQPDKALDFAKRYVGIEPSSAKAHILMGNVRWARGENAEAQKAFEKALQLEPKSSEAMFALGHLLSAQSPEKAKQYFEKYLSDNPENAAEVHFQIAAVDQRQGRINEAIAHLRSVVDLEPSNPQGHFALAQIYEVKKDTDAALGEYQKLLVMEPDDLGLINHTGELYFLKGDSATAEAQFLKAKNLSPHHPVTCLWLAMLAEQKGDFAQAARQLEDSSALGEDPGVTLRLSYYLSQANRLQDSVKFLEEAHRKWPDQTDLSYFLALGYADLKRYNDAITLLQGVLKKNQESRDARFELAAMYEKLGRIADMEREFKVLLERFPTDAVALNYLAYSLAERGIELQNAQALAQRAVNIDPSNGAYRDSLGWAYFREAKYEKAMEELHAAAQLLPDDSTVLEHLGDVHAALKQPEKAWEAWKTASVNDPNNKTILSKLSSVESLLSPKEMGERLAGFLARRRGPIAAFAGFARIPVTVGNKSVTLAGILSFKAPDDLSLEILGPLFVPMFHIQLNGPRGFSMDRIAPEGISPEALHQILERSFSLMRDYLSGAVFTGRPAEYHHGWRTRWISVPAYQLFLDDVNGKVQGVKSDGDFPLRLSLEGFGAFEGHPIPAYFRIEGKGFSLSFEIQTPKINFQ